MKIPSSNEMSDFKRHLEDIRQSQQDLQRVFEKGRRGGLWNPRDLQEYNRSLQDYKRHMADVERQHKAIERVKGNEGSSIRARQSIGVKVGGDELRRYDRIVRKERELLRLKEYTSRELSKHESHYRKMERSVSRAQIASGASRVAGYGKWAAAAAFGAVGYGYHQMMAGAQLHTQNEMARGATLKIGGQFTSGRTVVPIDPGPGGRQRAFREIENRIQQRIMDGKFSRGKVGPGEIHGDGGSPLPGSPLSNHRAVANRYQQESIEAYRKQERAKYLAQFKRRTIAGEMAKYEGYGMILGYSIPEAHQLAQGGLRALPGNRLRDMRSNLAMMRGYTLDGGSLTGYHSAARTGGYEGGAAALNQQLIAAFTKGRFPRALMGEFVQSLTQVSNTMASSGGVVNQRSAAHMLAVYGNALGQGYRQSPQRTAHLLQSLHQGITAPSGGDAGKAFVMRALGLGQGKSYWEILKQQSMGATPENVRAVLGHGMQTLGRQGTLYALHGAMGIKPIAAEKLLNAYNQGGLSDEMIRKQVGAGKNSDLDAARNLRLGFKALELQKMAEKAQIAATHVKAVTAAYEFQITMARTTADALHLVTGAMEGMFKTATKILRFVR